MKHLREAGWTFQRIGDKFGISRQCVHFYLSGKRQKGLRGREWTRELVRIRDKHTCQDCNKEWAVGMRRFDCHHINGLCGKMGRKYDRVDELDSMITLCHKCHYGRHDFSMRNKNLWAKKPVNC